MLISIFDLFKIGIGPSSSHTVGPMVAAHRFALSLAQEQHLSAVARLSIELFGSLGLTGPGHGSLKAVVLGLEGETPEAVDIATIEPRLQRIQQQQRLYLLATHPVYFHPQHDITFHRQRRLPAHSNGLRFQAFKSDGQCLCRRDYYSIGGGQVVDGDVEGGEEESGESGESGGESGTDHKKWDRPKKVGQTTKSGKSGTGKIEDQTDRKTNNNTKPVFAFSSAEQLLTLCRQQNLSIAEIIWANEQLWRSPAQIRQQLARLWAVMQDCVQRGCQQEGILPGGLQVSRRAPQLYQSLLNKTQENPLDILDWVSLYALAVNEENASGGRVVTAPTNGAAGIIPAVLHYYQRFVEGANAEGIETFLLTAAAIGMLCKHNASISGAEVGCQGEVGSACAMAAAGLTAVQGGRPEQIEHAAEIAMEHHLGLTCDPIGGLVQVPCIERNAVASVNAIHAARMALSHRGGHIVSLDKVIATMAATGRDMLDKYKETAQGGLAAHIALKTGPIPINSIPANHIPVNIVEC